MRPRTLLLSLATVAFATAAFAQDPNIITDSPDEFQVRYVSNLNKGDSYVNITNTGSADGLSLCALVFAFDPSEEMVSCCACPVTPNALVSLSVQGDLISNTISPSTPTSLVIKLVSIIADNGTCVPNTPGVLVPGMRAWGTSLHALPAGTYGVTETAFLPGGLSEAEAIHLFDFCDFINNNGSGFGICKSCRVGGLGGAKQ
jgi:hypothetical protein